MVCVSEVWSWFQPNHGLASRMKQKPSFPHAAFQPASRPTISQLWSIKIRLKTFTNYIKISLSPDLEVVKGPVGFLRQISASRPVQLNLCADERSNVINFRNNKFKFRALKIGLEVEWTWGKDGYYKLQSLAYATTRQPGRINFRWGVWQCVNYVRVLLIKRSLAFA